MFVVGLAGTIFGAYVITVLWRWFIVSAFGLPALRVPTAAGMTLMVSMVTRKTSALDRGVKVTWTSIWVDAVFVPLVALCVGWLWLQAT